MNFLLFLCGVFVLIDGLANVLYCLLKRVHYPLGKVFQLGRIIRAVAGILILLVAFGVTAQAQSTITDVLDGIHYEDCFLKSVTVLLDAKPTFSKNFAKNNVQGATFSEQITVFSTGNHTGLLILAGIGEKGFYGSFSLSFEVSGSGNEEFRPLGLEGWAWILIFCAAGTLIIILVAKRRHSN